MAGLHPKPLFHKTKNPFQVVNVCCIIVLFFSTLLTWREVVVLEEAYVSNQRHSLDNIAGSLDRQLQHSIDNLLFYRNTMNYALQSSISTGRIRLALDQFEQRRDDPFWQIRLASARSIPIQGVSDAVVGANSLLARDPARLNDEFSAALELSYILQFSDYGINLQRRTFYVSRAGFYLTSQPGANLSNITDTYRQLVAQSFFTRQSERYNRGRGVIWSHSKPPNADEVVTASVALDHDQRWYGVLGMDFTVSALGRFLMDKMPGNNEGTLLLYNRAFQFIASSRGDKVSRPLFDARDRHRIQEAMANETAGYLRMGSRFITWSRLNSFDGNLVKVHTWRQGVQGEFGRISIVLALLWLLTIMMMVVCWYVVRRLVGNMLSLQQALTRRANYDGLTRLYNRGAFFEQAIRVAQEARAKEEPYSVIQVDLDHFKAVNDRYGHHAGDLVLTHTGAILASVLRTQDVAGRVGGEEFAVVLPGASLGDAIRVAERIRYHISLRELFISQGTTIRISASFGVSSAQEQGEYNFEVLQSRADMRLYKAKENGRNQVCARD